MSNTWKRLAETFGVGSKEAGFETLQTKNPPEHKKPDRQDEEMSGEEMPVGGLAAVEGAIGADNIEPQMEGDGVWAEALGQMLGGLEIDVDMSGPAYSDNNEHEEGGGWAELERGIANKDSKPKGSAWDEVEEAMNWTKVNRDKNIATWGAQDRRGDGGAPLRTPTAQASIDTMRSQAAQQQAKKAAPAVANFYNSPKPTKPTRTAGGTIPTSNPLMRPTQGVQPSFAGKTAPLAAKPMAVPGAWEDLPGEDVGDTDED